MSDANSSLVPRAGSALLEECLQRFPDMALQCNRIIKDREEDFLSLGGRLQEFAFTAGAISRDVAALTELTSGMALERIIDELNHELESMHELSGRTANEKNQQALQAVLSTTSNLTALIGDFKRIVRTLQMLGISTRIESARLGQDGRGFNTLADDVEGLGLNIVSYTSKILEKSADLDAKLNFALERTEAMRAHREETSHMVTHGIAENLETLLAMAAKSQDISLELAPRSQSVARSIGEAVASLQFHDITRQQVEHVGEALVDVVNVVRDKDAQVSNGADAGGIEDLSSWIGDVLALQSHQMENAAERFVRAVENLKSQLGNISENIVSMGARVQEVGGAVAARGSGGGATTALGVIEEDIALVLDSMRLFTQQGTEVGRIMVSVADTVNEIAVFLGDIEEVGAEIELIALNASVKAAHTGEKGKALGVLASSIQRLSADARTQTEAIAEVLRSISGSAEGLKKNAASFMDNRVVEAMVARFHALMADLKQVNAEVSSLFAKVNAESGALGAAIAELTRGLAFHREVERELGGLMARMQALSEQADAAAPSGSMNRPERLKNMLKRYTMEVERLIHESAFQSEGRAATSGADQSASPEEDDSGNVELF